MPAALPAAGAPDPARFLLRTGPGTLHPKGPDMKKFALGLISAAALTTTFLLVRQQRDPDAQVLRTVPAGETQPVHLSLQRIRELGH